MQSLRLSSLLLVVFGLSGCQPPAVPSIGDVGKGLAASEAYRNTAYQHAEQPKVVRWALGDEGQKRTLAEASDALDRVEQSYAREREARIRAETDLAAERDQWFGDKLHRYVLWIAGLWVGLGLLAAYLSFATGGTSVIAGFLFNFLPAANVFKLLLLRKE